MINIKNNFFSYHLPQAKNVCIDREAPALIRKNRAE